MPDYTFPLGEKAPHRINADQQELAAKELATAIGK